MKQLCLVYIFLLCVPISHAQNYSVSSYTKINEVSGSFNGVLNTEDFFGISIDEIGDLDGNGVNDLAVGTNGDDDGGANRGAVWILFLDTDDSVIASTKISNTSGNFNGVLDNNDRFGGAVSYLGDMNNDGFVELAVGADYDGDGGFWRGAVWILSLNSDGTVQSHAKISDTQGGFTGVIENYAIFGTDITNIGDLNGDGIEDLAVGSRRAGGENISTGAVWILFMNSDFTVNSYQKIAENQGGFGELDNSDYFGGSVANIGDLNGDGIVDLAVGAYRDDDLNQNSGAFYVLFLNANGTVNTYQKVSNSTGGFTGEIAFDALFGESIDGVTDIDGDGKIEIVVGALRELSPSLNTQTGAFYIIELNSDGTVSEEYLYTYGESCFNGQLNSGDFFGGSVTFLNTNGPLKVATGAYRDSTNGYRKGAVWILNLGEINIGVETSNPNNCGSFNGAFTLTGLMPNLSYTVTFDHDGQSEVYVLDSNSQGDVIVDGLNIGSYINISISVSLSGACSYDIDDVFLDASNDFVLAFNTQSTSGCSNADGQILISNLTPNTLYGFDYEFEGASYSGNFTSDDNGQASINDLAAGIYQFLMVFDPVSPCTDGIGSIEIIGDTGLNASITSTDLTSCSNANGSITISNLSANENYSISYVSEGNSSTQVLASSASGEIVLSDLSAGNYEAIEIEELVSGCMAQLNSQFLNAVTFEPDISSTDPAGCNTQNGTISISNLTANTNYDISFDYNSTSNLVSLTSDNSGSIVITGLAGGTYESIIIEEIPSGCTATLDMQNLESTDFSAEIGSTNPTGCDTSDGSIIVSNLIGSANYSITYVFNSNSYTVSLLADASGIIVIGGLSAGTYQDIVIEELASGCTLNLSSQVLELPNFSAMIDSMDPSSCSAEDGTITISDLTPDHSYTLSYIFEETIVSQSYTSDISGVIELNDLPVGIYQNIEITENSTDCNYQLGSISLVCEIVEQPRCFKTKPFFTPNNDTVNDTWSLIPVDLSNVCSYRLIIFDRYGKIIKELTDRNSQWDGTYNGNKLPTSDYWYIVYYNADGKELTYASHFTLKR